VRILFVGGDFFRKGGDLVVDWIQSTPLADRCRLDFVTHERIAPHPNIRSYQLSHDDEELAQLYREADIFVLPTRAECFGLVFTEAMACAIPVVTCHVGGVSEVVEHGVTGLLVPPDDPISLNGALSALVSDVELRRRMGEAGRRAAEARFDSRRNISRLLEIMREVAEARS
jgi:glycosyltransferase involved in cell wall biosynthesis